MPARQVSAILDAIRAVHSQLANRYRELKQSATDERIILLLQDMQRREEKFSQCVADYESQDNTSVLNTWLQFIPDEVLQVDAIADQLSAPCSLTDLVEMTLKLNHNLVLAYLVLARNAPTTELQDLFANLAKIEERNDTHYVEALLD